MDMDIEEKMDMEMEEILDELMQVEENIPTGMGDSIQHLIDQVVSYEPMHISQENLLTDQGQVNWLDNPQVQTTPMPVDSSASTPIPLQEQQTTQDPSTIQSPAAMGKKAKAKIPQSQAKTPKLQESVQQPKKSIEAKELVDAKAKFEAKQYDAAIGLLSQAFVRSSQKNEILELLADCFYKTNRIAEALKLLQKVAHDKKDDLRIKAKIGDCLTKQSQFLKANLIYGAILRDLDKSSKKAIEKTLYADIKSKISENKKNLQLFQTWPTFSDLIDRVGLSGIPKTKDEVLGNVVKFMREINPRADLMWEIEMNKLKKLTLDALEKDPHVQKFAIIKADGTAMLDRSGKPIHFYQANDLSLLTHFSSPINAKKILSTLEEDKKRAPGDVNPYSFWQSQWKVCCSMVKPGTRSFYSIHNTVGIGFANYVPDPEWNIIHTWGKDCWTPTFFKAPGVESITGQTGEAQAIEYNEFMMRFQPLATYVYSIFQEADRIHQQLEYGAKFKKLAELIKAPYVNIKAIDSIFHVITGYFTRLDPKKAELDKKVSAILESIKSLDVGNPEVQDKLEVLLTDLKNALKNERGSQREERVNKQIEKLFDDLSASISVRGGS